MRLHIYIFTGYERLQFFNDTNIPRKTIRCVFLNVQSVSREMVHFRCTQQKAFFDYINFFISQLKLSEIRLSNGRALISKTNTSESVCVRKNSAIKLLTMNMHETHGDLLISFEQIKIFPFLSNFLLNINRAFSRGTDCTF